MLSFNKSSLNGKWERLSAVLGADPLDWVLELRKEFGSLGAYVWGFEPLAAQDRPPVHTYEAARALTATAASMALSKDLKKRGWSFVGPTTMYAFMQAMGLVNDHIEGCHVRQSAFDARAAFKVPQRT